MKPRSNEGCWQSDRQILAGRAATAMAHDLNNVLNTISCITDVLLLEQPPNSQSRVNLDEIKKAAHRGAALTRQLLDIGKRSTFAIEVVNLGELVSALCPVIGCALPEQSQLQLEISSGSWLVLTDPSLVEQLLLQLSLDTRHRMREGEPFFITISGYDAIDVSSARKADVTPGRYVKLLVGSDATEREDSPSPELRRVLAALQQQVGLECIQRQPNSQIALYLPCACEVIEAGSDPDAGLNARVDDPQSTTVLLVDDEDAARNATRRILKEEGYRVIEASSSKQALAVSSQCSAPIDLLFTDVVLPDNDGVALFANLQKLHPHLRVLFHSGHGSDVLARYKLPEDGYQFLQKPCRKARIIEGVRRALG